jgi:GxxExxY protein
MIYCSVPELADRSNPAVPPEIGVHLRLSAANNNLERNQHRTAHQYWPLMNTDERGFSDSRTEHVLGAIFEVSDTLGAGFLEKVYECPLLTELGLRGIRANAQASFAVTYKGHNVGEYLADILVEDVLVLEKCVERPLTNIPHRVSTKLPRHGPALPTFFKHPR